MKTTITEGNWTFTQDAYGDWRGTNAAGTRRTRLKFTLEWARKDVAAGRLQKLVNGEWNDNVDRSW